MNEQHKRIAKTILLFALIFFAWGFYKNQANKHDYDQAPSYSVFLEKLKNNEIQEVVIIEKVRGQKEIIVTEKAVEQTTPNPNSSVSSFNVAKPKKYKLLTPADQELYSELKSANIKFEAEKEEEGSVLLSILISWTPMILFIGIWIYFMRKSMGGGKGLFGMNKSKTKLISPEEINVTFADVVGADEAKLEVQEVIDFLKNSQQYTKLGGKIPKGILLTGPAGTGKTLLAKAIAKEAGVPFFANSGSDFVEMFVGLGAARVRDMFEEARKAAPCILFIDEIDTLGARRGGSFGGGGADEREQTLNQMLVEMDGVDAINGIIIVGATNRSDILDPALLRPGRLDRHVHVSLPDVKGREKILNLHINKKLVPVSTNLDLHRIAKGTTGFSGAEIENLVNEAAIMAARNKKQFVEQEDFEEAKDKIIMGPERKSMIMPEKERINTAYHESGHAVVAKLLPNADPVHKVTIIPRGRALGVTMQLPEEDKYAADKDYLLSRIAVLMGGRLGEEIFLNHMTTGASNDIQVATNMAKKMVIEWGMSDLGMVSFGDPMGSAWGGQVSMANISGETLREIDKEIMKIIHTQYELAKKLLEDNKDIVESMAKALLEVETIEDWQVDNIMERKDFNTIRANTPKSVIEKQNT